MKKGEEARLAEKEVELKCEASKPWATQRRALGQVLAVSVLKWLGFYVPFRLRHRMQVPRTGMTSGKDGRSSSKEMTARGCVLATLPIGGQQSSLMEDSGGASV